METPDPALPEGRADGREAVLDEAFSAAWKAYMGTKGSNHQSMILSWRNAVEAAADVIWASLAAPVVAVPEAGEGRSVLDPPTSEHSAAIVASMPGMGRGAEVCDNTYPPPGRDGTCLSCGKRRAPVVGERDEKP